MGCCSSKKNKDKVTEPQKTQQPEPESVGVDMAARKDVQIKSSLRQQELDDEDDRARKLALEKAEEKRRKEAEKKKKITRDAHSKLLSFVDDKYKNLQSLLIILGETLRKEAKDEKTVASLMENIKKDANDIEDSLPDLQAFPFPKDKEYIKNLKKIIELVRELELDYLSFKKKATKYPEYKENVLATLQREYPELFADFKGDKSSLSESFPKNTERHSSPHNEDFRTESPYQERVLTEDEIVVLKLREADNVPKRTTAYDEAFDKEMLPVIQQQKNEAVFELETAVQDYNRLLNEFNQMKQKQEYAKRDYTIISQEAKELRDLNNQLSYYNDALRVETGTLRSVQPELARNQDQVQQTTLALQKELMELRRQVQQREAENQQADREHQAKIQQIERETMQKQQEAKELERRYQEDLRKLFSKNDEVQQQRARIYEEENRQLGADNFASMPSVSQQFRYSPPKYIDDIMNSMRYSAAGSMRYSAAAAPMKSSFTPFEFPRKSLLAQETVMVNGERRSIHDLESTRRPVMEFPRRSVIIDHNSGPKLSEEIYKRKMMEEQMQSKNLEGMSSALDYSRKIRMEAGKSGIAAGMERMRAEIQHIPLNIDGEAGRMSTLTGSVPNNYASISPERERYSYEAGRLSSNEMVRSGDRNSVYMVGYV